MHRSIVRVFAAALLAAGAAGTLGGSSFRPGTVLRSQESGLKGPSVRWGEDLRGEVHRLEGHPFAIVLLGTECPIARQSIAALNEISRRSGSEVQLLGLLSDPTISRAQAAKFTEDYAVAFPVLFDASGDIARMLSPKVTPEAFVFDADGQLAYRGRIDNTYAALGQKRAEPTTHDLADAMDAVAANRAPTAHETTAIGCVFEAWRSSGGVTAKVTYNRDIAPLLSANCVSCHKPGEVAPFSLTNYGDASKRAELLAQVTGTGYMPPWRAAAQPHRFADERRLTASEVSLLKAWSEAGAPEGDVADAAPVVAGGGSPWKLGTPDIVVEMPVPFDIPASGRDMYRAFPVNVPLAEDAYVVASEFQAGAPSVVHHALLYLDTTGEARRKEVAAADGQPGYASFAGPGFIPSGGLGGWAPGALPSFLPDGVGRPISKGSDVVLQIHYHPDGKPHKDRSRLGIYLAKKPVTRVAISYPLANRQIDIAAGDDHYVRTMHMTLPRGVEVIGVTPHMHLIGRSMKVTATLPTGEVEQMIDVPQWDFRWQDQYRYAEPMMLPAGTKIEATAVYDNSVKNPENPSVPPKRVTRGEQTTDEMCLVFFQVVIDKQAYDLTQGLREAARGAGNAGGGLLRRLRGRP